MADKETGTETTIYRSKAGVRVATLSNDDRDELLDLAKKRAPDPSVFDEVEPFFFTTRASNTEQDAYFTYMDESSLQNYVNDATDPGVQFQNSHNGSGGFFGGGGEVGFGRSLQGALSGPKSKREALIDFYTIPGLRCGNMTSDEFIIGARSGVYSDVSIGFSPGRMMCNICGGDFLNGEGLSWDDPERCWHWPGRKYEVETKRSKKMEVCVLRVEDAHLHEVSVVYDGATPGAGIAAVDKARVASAYGKLSEGDRIALESLYHARIAPPQRLYAVEDQGGILVARTVTTNNTASTRVDAVDDKETDDDEETTVVESDLDDDAENPSGDDDETTFIDDDDDEEDDEEDEESTDRMTALREMFKGTPIKLGNDPYQAVEVLGRMVLDLRGKNKELARGATFGKAYEESLLADLDAAVVRAFGAEAAASAKKRYRKIAAGLDPEEIKELTADLNAQGDKRFKPGRQTTEGAADDEDEGGRTVADKREERGPTPARLVGIRK
jgi:hypothetical protein